MTIEQLQAKNIELEGDNRLLIEKHQKEIKNYRELLKTVTKERDELKEKIKKIEKEKEQC